MKCPRTTLVGMGSEIKLFLKYPLWQLYTQVGAYPLI